MIYYLRHGQTVWNRQLRLQGRDDSPLTLWGIELAMAYGRWLRDAVDDRHLTIVTSPLGRARQTAAIVADLLGHPDVDIVLEPLVAERDVGGWSGKTWTEIEREEGAPKAELRAWERRPPEGESQADVFERARHFLAKPREADVTVVVSHGGFSRAIRGAHLGLAPPAIAELSPHDHGRLYVLAGRDAEAQVDEVVTDASARPAEAALG